MQTPGLGCRFLWRSIRVGPRLAYTLGLGRLVGRFVLLLTTTGRRTGRPRTTPLLYEMRGGAFHVVSARGPKADWIRNIEANPIVRVRVGHRRLHGKAEVITDSERIADVLERQMRRSPKMFGAILQAEGLPARPTRSDLESLARRRPMVAIQPLTDGEDRVSQPDRTSAEGREHV